MTNKTKVSISKLRKGCLEEVATTETGPGYYAARNGLAKLCKQESIEEDIEYALAKVFYAYDTWITAENMHKGFFVRVEKQTKARWRT